MQAQPISPLETLARWMLTAGAVVLGGFLVAMIIVAVMRRLRLRWTWTLPSAPLAAAVWPVSPVVAVSTGYLVVMATAIGAKRHHRDLISGADVADAARRRRGLAHAVQAIAGRRAVRAREWITARGLMVGLDDHGHPTHVPVRPGAHVLVVGATGAGKTVCQAWIAARLIEHGYGAIVIDPKGDQLLADELQRAAANAGRPFWAWTPEGPSVYNPFGHGSDSEIADKALAGEVYTEPHYLRQAQRYVGWAVRVMHAIGRPITPVSLAAACDPRQLELASRQLPAPDAQRVQAYLDSLTPEQVRGLAGTRDRLAILAESDIATWLEPDGSRPAVNLLDAVGERAVVYLRLDADRRPLLAAMLATAIVQDLITVSAAYQRQGLPTLVMIDEFAAIAPTHVVRLFATARSAHMSLLLGTQELADLRPADLPQLAEQVIGNLAAVIAHRQNMPDSAEMIAQIAGTRGAWITTQKTNGFMLPSQTGTRTRGREFLIHPDRIKHLPTGTAAVVVPGDQAQSRVARILHPRKAR